MDEAGFLLVRWFDIGEVSIASMFVVHWLLLIFD